MKKRSLLKQNLMPQKTLGDYPPSENGISHSFQEVTEKTPHIASSEGEIMKEKRIPVIDIEDNICSRCGKDHKKEKMKTFKGAYDTYCVPLKKLNSFKTQLKNSPDFRKYLSLEEMLEESLLSGGIGWRNHHNSIDLLKNMGCTHGIVGGCTKCFGVSSQYDDPEEPLEDDAA